MKKIPAIVIGAVPPIRLSSKNPRYPWLRKSVPPIPLPRSAFFI
jgi:hypothetical protein